MKTITRQRDVFVTIGEQFGQRYCQTWQGGENHQDKSIVCAQGLKYFAKLYANK